MQSVVESLALKKWFQSLELKQKSRLIEIGNEGLTIAPSDAHMLQRLTGKDIGEGSSGFSIGKDSTAFCTR